jgi:hypothetical protein
MFTIILSPCRPHLYAASIWVGATRVKIYMQDEIMKRLYNMYCTEC